MSKPTLITIFYVVYFTWLFTLTYLTSETDLLNYFTSGVAVFYLLLLREKWDILIFMAGGAIPVIFTIFSFSGFGTTYHPELVPFIPLWLPLAWATTTVALRKFFVLISA